MVFILFYLASSAMAFDFIHNKTILSDLKACKLLIDSLPIVGHICRISQLHYLSMATTSIIPPIRHTSFTFPVTMPLRGSCLLSGVCAGDHAIRQKRDEIK